MVAAAASATALRAVGLTSQVAKTVRERVLVGDELGAARGIERLVNLREIPDMRAMDDGGAEPDRLDRVLTAAAGERAAHEHDRRKPIDQAELAERVGDKDVDIGFGQIALRAQRHREAGVFGGFARWRGRAPDGAAR